MLRGIYTATAGMMAEQARQQTLTNNLANAMTPGFKQDLTAIRSFPNVLLSEQNGMASQNDIGGMSTGVYAQENLTDFTLGTPQTTNQPTDFALISQNLPVNSTTGKQGALFFSVQQPDGSIRYTRNGSFTLDGLNRLTTSDGNLVLNTNGQPITLSSDQFQVASDGTITVNGQQSGKVGIAYAANPDQLEKAGNDLYQVGANGTTTLPMAQSVTGVSYSMKQGALEQSNVQLDQTMTDLLTAYRSFEANQKVLKAYDSTLDLAANKVGVVE